MMLRMNSSGVAVWPVARPRQIVRSVLRVCVISLMASVLGITCAHAIVSDRHLQGVRALECALESSPAEFRLLVNTKKHTLQLENETKKIAYEEVSETTMRFRLVLPEAPARICEIEFPAGSLVCTRDGGESDLGFCLPVH